MSTIIEIKNLTIQFDKQKLPLFSNLNYKIKSGDFVLLLGSNGSGKSSLLKILNGEFQPKSGEVSLLNQSVFNLKQNKRRKLITYLNQNTQESLFPSLTVLENAKLFARKINKNNLQQHLSKFNQELPLKLNDLVNDLSGGQKQALALALIMLQPPQLLLLDEHTSALDPVAAKHIMQLTQQLVDRYKITCVMTTHHLPFAHEYGNRIIALRDGKALLFDEATEAKNRVEVIEKCYAT